MSYTHYETREEWLEGRKGAIGSSDAAALIGWDPGCSPYMAWARREGYLDVEDNSVLRRGRHLEAGIASWWLEENREEYAIGKLRPQEHTVHQSERYSWLKATPDFVIEPEDLPGPSGLLEVKSVGFGKAHEWKDGIPPMRFQIQLQHQLHCSGLTWGVVCGLIAGGGDGFQMESFAMDYDPDFFDNWLMPQLEDAWAKMQQPDGMPLDHQAATWNAIKAQYHTARRLRKLEIEPETARELVQAKRAADEAKNSWTLARNKVARMMGDAELATVNGVAVAKWAQGDADRRARFTVTAAGRELFG